MNPVVLVASRSGGVGKTLLAQLVTGMSFERRWPYRPWRFAPIAIDTMRLGERSKLGRLYPECIELAMTPTLEAGQANGAKALYLWHKVAKGIEVGGCVMDLGANAAPLFSQLLGQLEREGDFRAPSQVTLVVPATASGQALANAREAVAEIGFSTAWRCKTIVVLNEVHGGLEIPKETMAEDLSWIVRCEREGKLKLVRLPRCESKAWGAIEKASCPLYKAIAMSDDDFGKRFGFSDAWSRAEARMQLSQWVQGVGSRLREAGLFLGTDQ